jgi:hypothetical protein
MRGQTSLPVPALQHPFRDLSRLSAGLKSVGMPDLKCAVVYASAGASARIWCGQHQNRSRCTAAKGISNECVQAGTRVENLTSDELKCHKNRTLFEFIQEMPVAAA